MPMLKGGTDMETQGFAYFAEGPRTISDLRMPHTKEQELPYEIVNQVELAAIDFENFITDMKADRQFIEDNAPLCSCGETWKCILVRKRGGAGGILVMPKADRFVGWATIFP